jgi:nitronate monooxygenase
MKDAEMRYTVCPAKEGNENYFCICNGLLSSAGYNSDEEEALYTVGTNASRVDKIVSVKTLMDELTGTGG